MLRRVISGILVLLFAGLLAAGWYAYNKGFTQKWRKFVVREFHKRGIELSLSRLTLEPFGGIVAKQVRLYDNRDRKRVVAVVDEVRLVINYANLFQGRAFIDALDLRDANLDVPLDPSKRNGTKVEIRHLSGLLFLPPKQVYLSRLEAELYGVRFRASGQLINPQTFSFASKRGDGKNSDPAQFAERCIAELKRLSFEGAPPQIDVRFSGDLAEPEKIFIEATLWAERVRRDAFRLENLYVNCGFRDGVVRLRQISANDAGGALRASGSYDATTHEAALQLHSGLDVQALARGFTRSSELEEVVFYAPPRLDLTMRANVTDDSPFQVIGHTRLEKFAYKSVIFDGFDADLSWDGERWAAIDVRLAHRTGEITGEVLQVENEFRSHMKNTISRKVLAPILTGRVGEWFQKLEFSNSAARETVGPKATAALR